MAAQFSRLWRTTVLLLLGLALGLGLASVLDRLAEVRSEGRKWPTSATGDSALVHEALQTTRAFSLALSHIAEKVVQSVVSIHSVKILTGAPEPASSPSSGPVPANPRDFRFSIPQRYRQEGTGSGVIISSDGYIITNYHVVSHAQEIEVTLYDQRTFRAQIVGLDRLSEVAVIKIDARNLPFARLGNSDSCRVGQLVLAIGNPLDLSSTVTVGIISALGRQIDIINDNFAVESFIQTDAAINPGNSGGALVNLDGEVIGINTAIATETGYDMGFGFAIPINLVRKISIDLIKNGHVVRGYLGIAMQNVTELHARALGLPRPIGVFVDDVFPNSPAEKSGIRAMDVILSIDDLELTRPNQLQAYIARKSPGQAVRLQIYRDGRVFQHSVTLGSREDGTPSTQRSVLPQKQYKQLGIQVEPLTEFDSIELGYSGTHGVLVTAVSRYSPAEKAGIQVDDILVAINRKPVRSVEDFQSMMNSLRTGEVAVLKIFRASGYFHYFIEVP